MQHLNSVMPCISCCQWRWSHSSAQLTRLVTACHVGLALPPQVLIDYITKLQVGEPIMQPLPAAAPARQNLAFGGGGGGGAPGGGGGYGGGGAGPAGGGGGEGVIRQLDFAGLSQPGVVPSVVRALDLLACAGCVLFGSHPAGVRGRPQTT